MLDNLNNSTIKATMCLVWFYYVLLKVRFYFSIDIILITYYQFVIIIKLALILVIVRSTTYL